MRKTVKKIHKWVGIIIATYVVLVSISGFVHIIAHNGMHGGQKAKPVYMTSVGKTVLSPSEATRDFILPDQITAVNLREVGGLPYYQVWSDYKVNYFNAITGSMADIDTAYAGQIASQYLGGAKLGKWAVLTKYDDEYTNYKGPVPVYSFDTEGGKWERVYVSTQLGSVVYYVNDNIRLTNQIFRWLHMFSFIPQNPRDIFSGIMVLGLVLVTLFGVILFFKPKKKS